MNKRFRRRAGRTRRVRLHQMWLKVAEIGGAAVGGGVDGGRRGVTHPNPPPAARPEDRN